MTRAMKWSTIAVLAAGASALVFALVWMLRGFVWLVWLLIVTLLGFVQDANAHDIYNNLRQDGTTTGRLCCGGDPVTGDCEAVRYQMNPDGTATFLSERYGKVSVLIGADKITWMSVPGGEHSEAHWCGVPRTKVQLAPIDAENPDPNFWTYCAFIAPGGV